MLPKTFASIQVYRAIAANAVVVSHLVIVEVKYGRGFALLPDWLAFAGQSGVHFFFVISGLVMALIAPQTDWRAFIAARMLRIYPVYWIYTSLVLAVFLVAPAMVNSSYDHPPSILKSYLLWPQDVAPLLAVGWTLIHEMYFYLVIAAMLAFAVPLGRGFAVWALAVVAGYLLLGPFDQPVLAVVFSPLTLEFILGAAVGLLIAAACSGFARLSLCFGAALFGLGAVFYVAGGIADPGVVTSVLLLGLPFPLIVYGGAALEARGGWPSLRLLEKLGDASYSIYLSHVLVLSAIGRLFAAFPFHGWLIEGMFLAGCLVTVNGLGYLSYRRIEKPILRLRRLLPRR